MTPKDKLASGSATIGVLGLGYVGLPLVLGFAEKNIRVIGFDVDQRKVDALNSGNSYIQHISPDRVSSAVSAGTLSATTDFSRIPEADVIIICVPTPLNSHHEPDLSFVRATRDTILPHLRPNQLVCLESTTYPGTTDEEFLLQIRSRGFSPGSDFFLVFSPEREDPGNPDFHGTGIPKVVGGFSPACLEQGLATYGAIYQKVVPVSSTRVAEMVKLLENIFRAVNIGLVNEMKIVADAMGIDIWEVINAAKTKPFGFTAFYPGPGLGGHCIPIDPFYLTWKAREFGIHTRFIELAGEINEGMPHYVVRRVAERLNQNRKALNGSRILIMGLAYKANVDDMRESPTFKLFDLLKAQGAEIAFHDPHIPVITPTREHAEYTGLQSIPWNRESVGSFDVVLISTHHLAVNLTELAAWAPVIVDTRNAMASTPTAPGQVTKA
ncbi:MAG: UDP-N-acetyl-D-glucosamine dehydrogenase [Verrucomicrobia bacterium]|nr:MAG: UDP-N-acetyl-D-glucosamine dehydrogenase [Verrucomicrobiota bacterium]